MGLWVFGWNALDKYELFHIMGIIKVNDDENGKTGKMHIIVFLAMRKYDADSRCKF